MYVVEEPSVLGQHALHYTASFDRDGMFFSRLFYDQGS